MQVDAAAHAPVHRPGPTSAPVAPSQPAGDEAATSGVKGKAASHALFQGNGNKTGIIQRLSTDEILASRSQLNLKAGETADQILASRTTPAPAPEDEVEPETGAPETPTAIAAPVTSEVPVEQGATDLSFNTIDPIVVDLTIDPIVEAQTPSALEAFTAEAEDVA